MTKSSIQEKIQKLHAVAAEDSGATHSEKATAKNLIEKLKAQLSSQRVSSAPKTIKVGDRVKVSSKHPLQSAFNNAELIVSNHSPTQNRFHCLVIRNGKAQSRHLFHPDHLELV